MAASGRERVTASRYDRHVARASGSFDSVLAVLLRRRSRFVCHLQRASILGILGSARSSELSRLSTSRRISF